MAFIQPLELETWIMNIFSGNSNIFLAIALIVILSLAAFFRMNGIIVIFMIGLFFAMFNQWINVEIYFVLIALASVLVGYWIRNIVK